MSEIAKMGMDVPQLEAPSKAMPKMEGKKGEELMKAAKQFEALFTNMVMEQMREMVPDSEVFGDSGKVKFFQGMLDDEYSKLSASRNGTGLAQMIYKQMSQRFVDAESKVEGSSKEDTKL
ncbi:MAG: hypothetical protein COV44_11980 [Deltaproteobacteria bacterium CG11_big_fil_rev_8_21_14_0_20_45_16]|nr:MAG: hypothetical protein COV44_11980 [Deltaproteobacteria bacterium CG11_big_fil_rev_8_21_14_0_20_45_16]